VYLHLLFEFSNSGLVDWAVLPIRCTIALRATCTFYDRFVSTCSIINVKCSKLSTELVIAVKSQLRLKRFQYQFQIMLNESEQLLSNFLVFSWWVDRAVCSIVVKLPTNSSRNWLDLLMYFRFTPTCFGKWLPSSGSRMCLRSHSSSFCIVGVYRLRSVHDNWPHWTDRNPYKPTTQTLLELLLRYLRPPEDGNHLPKHTGVNLEYSYKIHWFLDALCWSFTTTEPEYILMTAIRSQLFFLPLRNTPPPRRRLQ
jgi:hypothetical protein